MSRYLVTGATGFLGSHLVRALAAHKHEVVALARSAGREMASLGATPRKGDVLDRESLAAAVAGCDGVFHCAGNVSRRAEDAEELYRVHVEGTKNVLAAAKLAGVKRVVVASSSGTVAVSEDPNHLGTEADETPLALISRWPYYRAKLFAERAALSANGGGFEVLSVNPTLLLGPGDERGSSTEDVKLFLERKIPAVPPGGISFVDVRDAAVALHLAMHKGIPGDRYLVGACNLTLREFFARLERISGVKAPWIPVPRAPQLAKAGVSFLERALGRAGLKMPIDATSLDMSQFYWYLDATHAETALGWSSRDPLQTLSDTVDDLRARGVVWPADAGSAAQ